MCTSMCIKNKENSSILLENSFMEKYHHIATKNINYSLILSIIFI